MLDATKFVEAFSCLREVNLDQDKQIIGFIFREKGWGAMYSEYAKPIQESCKLLIKAGLLKAESNCSENFEVLSVLLQGYFYTIVHAQNMVNAFELLKSCKIR